MGADIRYAILVAGLLTMQPRIGHALPPVQYFGKLESTFRATRPSAGVDTDAFTNTLELGATSYIWQPWFGVWRAVGAVSRSDTSADVDSNSSIFTGDLEVNLFHRSHFPLTAFVSLNDSRVEIENLGDAASALRTKRFGLIQQYQDLDDSTFYLGSFNRDEQEDMTTDEKAVSNRLLFSADRRGQAHSFNGTAALDQNSTTLGDSELVAKQGNVSHTYTPNDRLSVTNTANAAIFDAQSDFDDQTTTLWGVGSQALWRPDGDKWRLRGDLRINREESESQVRDADFRDSYRARASARYEISEEASVFGEVGYDRFVTEESSQTTTFQALSGDYTSKPIPWRQFDYTWTAGAGVAHEKERGDDSVLSQNLNLGHGVTRVWTPNIGGPVPIVFSAGQDARVLNESDDEAEYQILHRATVSGSSASDAGSTTGYLNVFDIRTYGRTDVETLSLNASLTHNRALTRYRNIDMSASYNYNLNSSEGQDSANDLATLELRYRDVRLFDVRHLTLESRLRAAIGAVFTSDESDQNQEVEWDNELEYQIGLLEINGRVALTHTEARSTWLFVLSAIRRF